MAYSYVQYVGNASTVTFSVPFPYISKEHVEVRVNNVLKTVGTDYTWSSSSAITFVTAPATGLTVDIRRRSSPTNRLVDFQDGSTLTQDILDADSNQNFFLAQESFDAVDQRLPLDTDGQWDANSRRIKNVTDPVNAQDAATKHWAENSATSFIVAAQSQANAASASATAAANSATSAASSATSATSSANSASTSATNAASSASTATTKASEASTSATNAATSATNAANSATTASGYLASVQTNATNAATSATAAAASATSAASSASSATSSATNANTSAVNAASSESNANASKLAAAGSATSAANSASSASTSATTATTAKNDALAIYGSISAVNAAVTSAQTSATNSATSAGQAATSATNAANSATAAASSATSAASSSVSAATSATDAAALYGSASALNTAVNSAQNSATNAGTSAAQASSSQSAAASSATQSANSATQAAASAASASAIVLGSASNRASVRPSLLLDFANTRQLDPRVTFQRASTGKFYDGTSVVKAEENLLIYSDQFDNANWFKGAISATANSTTAPDGTSTADTITADGTSASHYTSQTTTAGVVRTFSVYAKAGTNNYIQLAFGGDASAYANFDISTGIVGTVGATATASITSIGNSWYRCTIYPTSTAVTTLYIALISGTTVGRLETNTLTTTAYLWGAQCEARSILTAYTPTTTAPITNYIPALQTALVDKPRFDVDPVTGESKGLLIEEQRTNLLTYSSDYSNASWTKNTSTPVDSNVIISPDGTLNGSKISTLSSSGTWGIYKAYAGTTGQSFSVYAKAGDASFLTLDTTAGINCYAVFNLSTGSVVSSLANTASITPIGNGWYRCVMANTTINTGYVIIGVRESYTSGNPWASTTGTGKGIYIWGAQLEAGSFATSYIPTVASQVTRSADSASMTGSNFSSWYRADEGTFYGEMASFGLAANNPTLFTAYDGTPTNLMQQQFSTSGRTESFVRLNNATQADMFASVSWVQNSFVKQSLSYKTNDFATSSSGVSVVTDTVGLVPSVNQMLIGSYPTVATSYTNGTIKRIAYYPKRLSNTELQGITNNS